MRILFIFILSVTFAHAQDFAAIARESARQTDIVLGLNSTSVDFHVPSNGKPLPELSAFTGEVAACKCDVTIPSSAWYVDIDKKTNANAYVLVVKPGQTVCFADGIRGPIEFHNINGLPPDLPITFAAGAQLVKKGGAVTISIPASNIQLVGNIEQLKLDASYVPMATSTIPAGTGYADYVKPAPVVTKTISPALIEKEVTDGVIKYYLITESGYRKLLE